MLNMSDKLVEQSVLYKLPNYEEFVKMLKELTQVVQCNEIKWVIW